VRGRNPRATAYGKLTEGPQLAECRHASVSAGLGDVNGSFYVD